MANIDIAFRQLFWWLGYRSGFAPWDTDHPVPMVVEAVEGPDRMVPGRALDLGCGTGRNAIYLARHGWKVTGVDLVGHAVAVARRRAEAAGVSVRLVEGDVTRLDELRMRRRFDLLVDCGCYHAVPMHRRDAYARGATAAAAPGARMLMYGVGTAPVPGAGVTAPELRRRFTGWRLVSAVRMEADELRRSVRTGPGFEVAMALRWFAVWRYRLELGS